MPAAQSYVSWGMIIILIVAFYLLLIRPQKKREKLDKAMRDALVPGDRICTIGGIIGRVISIGEETITIETSSNHTRMKVYKWAIRNQVTEDDQTIDHTKKAKRGQKAAKKAESSDKTDAEK